MRKGTQQSTSTQNFLFRMNSEKHQVTLSFDAKEETVTLNGDAQALKALHSCLQIALSALEHENDDTFPEMSNTITKKGILFTTTSATAVKALLTTQTKLTTELQAPSRKPLRNISVLTNSKSIDENTTPRNAPQSNF